MSSENPPTDEQNGQENNPLQPTDIKSYTASIYPGKNNRLPQAFAEGVLRLQKILHAPVFLLVQNENRKIFREITSGLFQRIKQQKGRITEDKPCALLLDSPGGDAHVAYRIARLFQRRVSTLTVVVPSFAKSAATLLSLGANELILGRDAELGPLDVQMLDRDREDFGSALDAVQSLERLHAFSMTATDSMMQFLLAKTGKKVDSLLPSVLRYITEFNAPLLQKIDTVDYTKKSRELKVAEEYAMRLLHYAGYPWDMAGNIATTLVGKYPTHGFVVDREEVQSQERIGQEQVFGLGLRLRETTPEMEKLFDEMECHLDRETAIGFIEEVGDETRPE